MSSRGLGTSFKNKNAVFGVVRFSFFAGFDHCMISAFYVEVNREILIFQEKNTVSHKGSQGNQVTFACACAKTNRRKFFLIYISLLVTGVCTMIQQLKRIFPRRNETASGIQDGRGTERKIKKSGSLWDPDSLSVWVVLSLLFSAAISFSARRCGSSAPRQSRPAAAEPHRPRRLLRCQRTESRSVRLAQPTSTVPKRVQDRGAGPRHGCG